MLRRFNSMMSKCPSLHAHHGIWGRAAPLAGQTDRREVEFHNTLVERKEKTEGKLVRKH